MKKALSPLRRKVWRLAGALGFVCALWACNAPFIPVPPPGVVFDSQTIQDSSGETRTVWTATGDPDAQAANAKFFLFNNNAGNGIIIRAGGDGSYTTPFFDGNAGDSIYIYFETPAGEDSESVCRSLVAGPAEAPSCQ
jgi:hypothetical protein